jgi:hypothetical protein
VSIGDKKRSSNNAFEITVFYHLTYEGAVDIENVDDPLERESLEAQINEFGQTPKQLFDNPHPQKLPKVTNYFMLHNALYICCFFFVYYLFIFDNNIIFVAGSSK